MNYCKDCCQNEFDCVCEAVTLFFEDIKDLPKKENQKPIPNKCLACFFDPCRCFGKNQGNLPVGKFLLKKN